MLTKNQRLIYALAGLKTIIGDYEFETKVKDNDTGEVDIVDCYKEIETLIVEFINPQPYKFEELKPDMFVFDCIKNRVNKIIEIFEHDFEIPYIKFDDGFGEWFIVEFKEGRFFPPTKAMEYQE